MPGYNVAKSNSQRAKCRITIDLLRWTLLPLILDRELKELVVFYKCFYGFTDINVQEHTSLISHGRTTQKILWISKLLFAETGISFVHFGHSVVFLVQRLSSTLIFKILFENVVNISGQWFWPVPITDRGDDVYHTHIPVFFKFLFWLIFIFI